jgi:toxin-antitoxin system PIN domain toxin
MRAVDVNLIVYLARNDLPFHQEAVEWFENRFSAGEGIFLFEPVLSSAMRILSNRRIFKEPMPSEKVIDFTEVLISQPEVVIARAGENHWKIFIDLCKKMKAKGDVIPDLYFAALALEKGVTWYSTDRDFSKIPRLQWRHPFEE